MNTSGHPFTRPRGQGSPRDSRDISKIPSPRAVNSASFLDPAWRNRGRKKRRNTFSDCSPRERGKGNKTAVLSPRSLEAVFTERDTNGANGKKKARGEVGRPVAPVLFYGALKRLGAYQECTTLCPGDARAVDSGLAAVSHGAWALGR